MRKKNTEQFINEARALWGDRFSYEKVEYRGGRNPVEIFCTKHQRYFCQKPDAFINRHQCSCPQCKAETFDEVHKSRRMSKDEFIKKCKIKFGDAIDVSQCDYQGPNAEIQLFCNKGHGFIPAIPKQILNSKYGCPKCMEKSRSDLNRISCIEFRQKSVSKFGDKLFSFDDKDYLGYDVEMSFFCLIHKETFTSTPQAHLRSRTGNCPLCYKDRMEHVNSSMTSEQYINEAQNIWGNKYCYNKTDYRSYKKTIIIHCNKHNYDFERLPKSHLNGAGCPLCEDEDFAAFEERKRFLQNERAQIKERIKWKRQRRKVVWKLRPKRNQWNVNEFVRMAKLIHEDDYDYTIAIKEYKDQQNTPVNIFCKRHSYYFKQTPDKHLLGQGCPKCIGRHRTIEDFKEEATFLFQGKYDYSETIYQGCYKKVKIFCNKHKQFFNILPSKHLEGEGCPICSASSLENELVLFLKQNTKILFIKQKQFDWLRISRTMPLDIYIPRFNLAIECQGMQHFSPSTLFGGDGAFDKQLNRDQIKYELCKQHGITIWYYASTTYNVPEVYHDKVFTKLSDLLDELKKLEVLS